LTFLFLFRKIQVDILSAKGLAMTRNSSKIGSAGGTSVKRKKPPQHCPKCGLSMSGRKWHSYLGHLSRHKFADQYFAGDTKAATRYLYNNALAATDPFPGNNAFPKYQPLPKKNG
jgi:hypothetical protein